MSSGFFSFFAHTGVLLALDEVGLRPSHVGGSSAGALVAALWASGRETSEIRDELLTLKREEFWDPAFGLGFLRGQLFQEKLERDLGCTRFEDCRADLSVVVHDVWAGAPVVLESGSIPKAVYASCAVPFLFQPVWHERRLWTDGGVSDRAAVSSMRSGVRTLHHHIASRSPWRRKNSPALQPPRGPLISALVFEGLPRVGPFRLEMGEQALMTAHRLTRQALEAPRVPVRQMGAEEGISSPSR